MRKILVKRFVVKEFQAAEALKALRTNLLFSGASVQAIALTSYGMSEGKSAIAFQLAAFMAQAGKRVLLLDTDLRMSCLEKRLQIDGKVKGLSHYLSGMANADELLCETDIPGMYIMFAGKRVPNAMELLGEESFKKLVTALKKTFDYVIVDTSPMGQVVDCAVIAPVLDGVALLVDSTNNSYKCIRRVKQQLEKSGARILGVVLNKVETKQKRSYYKGYGPQEADWA